MELQRAEKKTLRIDDQSKRVALQDVTCSGADAMQEVHEVQDTSRAEGRERGVGTRMPGNEVGSPIVEAAVHHVHQEHAEGPLHQELDAPRDTSQEHEEHALSAQWDTPRATSPLGARVAVEDTEVDQLAEGSSLSSAPPEVTRESSDIDTEESGDKTNQALGSECPQDEGRTYPLKRLVGRGYDSDLIRNRSLQRHAPPTSSLEPQLNPTLLQNRLAEQQGSQETLCRETEREVKAEDEQKVNEFLRSRGFKGGVNSKKSSMRKFRYPLHFAVKEQDAEMVKLLLLAGADKSLKNSSGNLPAQKAFQYSKQKKGDAASMEVLRALG
jgi:hypothetical protein